MIVTEASKIAGQGPYRVYKNRLLGQEIFVHTKGTNYTSTGRDLLSQPSNTAWVYPEFAGYYGQLNWATLQTTEQPFTVVTPTTNLFSRVLTPPASGNGNADTTYPPGAISLLHGISAIGDKFHATSSYGPSAAQNSATGLYTGAANFFFGPLLVTPPGPPLNFTLNFGGSPIVQAAGNDWNTANNWNPNGQPASASATSNPGSTYEIPVGSRLRTPVSINAVFPGTQLTIDGDGVFENGKVAGVGELRIKHIGFNPATNTYSQLVLNGGEILNGDTGLLVLRGELKIQSNSVFYIDTPDNRPVQIDSWLTGAGDIFWFREKEASYYTIKQIWSPVQLPDALPANFNGTLPVENRFEFTSLSQCHFTWQLRKFGEGAGAKVIAGETIASPRVGPKKSGVLKLHLPRLWKNADALAVTANDPNGHELWTWVYPLSSQTNFIPTGSSIASTTVGSELVLKNGETEVRIEPAASQLLGVKVAGKTFSLTSASIANAKWTMLNSGWLKLDYSVDPTVQTNLAGVAFDYPEEKMLGKTWLGDGPYRVWRNRLKGGTLGVWETASNTTETGYKDWMYPEFAGYFANVRWLKLVTTEGTLTMRIPDEKTFVRVGTPRFPPAKLSGKAMVNFPPGDLAVVRDIPPIGTKFHIAAQLGPQSTTPLVRAPYQSSIYLHFDPVTAAAAK